MLPFSEERWAAPRTTPSTAAQVVPDVGPHGASLTLGSHQEVPLAAGALLGTAYLAALYSTRSGAAAQRRGCGPVQREVCLIPANIQGINCLAQCHAGIHTNRLQ
jgi:hypothetical protein